MLRSFIQFFIDAVFYIFMSYSSEPGCRAHTSPLS